MLTHIFSSLSVGTSGLALSAAALPACQTIVLGIPFEAFPAAILLLLYADLVMNWRRSVVGMFVKRLAVIVYGFDEQHMRFRFVRGRLPRRAWFWLTSRATWHAVIRGLIRFGYGRAGFAWFVILAVLAVSWAAFGAVGFWNRPETKDICANGGVLRAVLETGYQMVASLFPNEELYNEVTNGKPRLSIAVEAARFLAVLLVFWLGAIPLFRWLIRNVERIVPRRALSGHYVIVGLGQAGQSLLVDLTREGNRNRCIVAVETSRETAQAKRAAARGAIILEGDGRDPNLVETLGMHRAVGIFVATGDENANIDIAAGILNDWRARKKRRDGAALSAPIIVPLINDRVTRQRIADDPRFLGLGKKERPAADEARILPFSTVETAARQLFGRQAIAHLSSLLPSRRAHLVVIGFGDLGETLLLEGLQACLCPGMAPPKVTVIDREPAARMCKQFAKRYPGLGGRWIGATCEDQGDCMGEVAKSLGIDIVFRQYDFDFIDETLADLAEPLPEGFEPVRALLTDIESFGHHDTPLPTVPRPRDPVTAVFVCLGSDERNLGVALALQTVIERSHRWLAPTFVRLSSATGLAHALSKPGKTLDLADVIDDFGSDDSVCSRHEIFERPWEKSAALMHMAYDCHEMRQTLRNTSAEQLPKELAARFKELSDRSAKDKASPGQARPPSARATGHFEALAPTYTRANLAQVMHLPVKLHGLGYRPYHGEPPDVLGPWPVADIDETDAVTGEGRIETGDTARTVPARIMALARIEHHRWVLERAANGWRPSTERDNARKLHDALVPWNDVTTEERRKDIAHVLDLKEFVRQGTSKRVWRPEVVIGVLGAIDLRVTESADRTDDRERLIETIEGRLANAARSAAEGRLGTCSDQGPPGNDWYAVTLIADLPPKALGILAEAGSRRFGDRRFRLLVPRSFPSHENDGRLDRTFVAPHPDDRIATDDGARQEELSNPEPVTDWWVIDLVPPGMPLGAVREPPAEPRFERLSAARRTFRERQRLRAMAYVIERSDRLIIINGPNPDPLVERAGRWWTGEAPIAVDLSSDGPEQGTRVESD